MNQPPLKCFTTSMTHPLLKNALCLVSNEGRVKCLLLLYKWLYNAALPQSSLAVTGNAFVTRRREEP